ncbi:MAG: hypothetical protein H7255_05760 [Ramlibacter sp.]|nr:hypothetical protein [Ramlibacter sp.]
MANPIDKAGFTEFVKAHAANADRTKDSVDWAERKQWWISKVSQLLTSVELWLAPLVEDGVVKFTRTTVTLSEEKLGQYEIPLGIIEYAGQPMHIKPIASVVLGGFGRVDIYGPNGRVLLVLTQPDEDLPPEKWRESALWFVAQSGRRTALTPLDQSSFQQTFADLFGLSTH